jgi:hypothetical protein
VLTFRYVLHLKRGDAEDIVRYTSSGRLDEGQTLAIAGRGKWIVCTLVVSDDRVFSDGVAYCRPAT